MIKHSSGRLPLVGLAVMILAASLVWLQAGSAQAAYSDCPPQSFCLYTQADGNGEMVPVSPGSQLDYSTAPELAAKSFASFRNNTTSWACLYDSPSYGGTETQAVLPGHTGADLPKNPDGQPRWTPASHKFAKSKAGCRTGYERCKVTRVCIFQGPSGRGVAGVTNQTEDLGNGVLGNRDYSVTWDDKVVSVANRSNNVVCFFPDPGYAGRWEVGGAAFRAFVVPPGHETTLPRTYQASISSHKLAGTEAGC
ncbi:peptidase inhibitor family I36 protein [Streptomyces sp. NPDC015346]|uniref:peptidase inhibitor family I36 protein n=1 Tax=Streptomyces sp. NPDC015346 TaxID=3364954 RepID=UPI0036F57DB3